MTTTRFTLQAAAALLGLALLSACATTPAPTGAAVRENIRVQLLDPAAPAVAPEAAAIEGEKAERALERYRKDTGVSNGDRLVQDIGD